VLHAYELFFERKLRRAGIADSVLTEYRQQVEEEALRRLTQLVSVHLSGPTRAALYAKHGHPANVMRAMVEDLEPDLIVMGKNEHSVLEKLLIGSITKHVLHEINCDVLIVTPA
jgi:nucleotide-binding universal stress UspA family protein